MTEYRWGKKRFEFHGGLPRLFLHETHERRVRLCIRAVGFLGVLIGIATLDWYYSLALGFVLLAVGWFLEKTLFYYPSMFVGPIMHDYDRDEWQGMVVVQIGGLETPSQHWIVGICVKTEEYAERFFAHLQALTGREDDEQGDLRLTFIVDEDTYYVYLYSEPMRQSFLKYEQDVRREYRDSKHGKVHFPLMMTQIICKGFETTNGFALGMFLDSHESDKEFLLAPYTIGEDGSPTPSASADPIRMTTYKFRLPHELSREDLEYYHWDKIVRGQS